VGIYASYIVGVSGNHDNSDTRVGLRKIVVSFLQCNRKHPSSKHRIVLIGDCNMRGYVSSLEPLLTSNYNLYSVMKPGSGTNELEKSANETVGHLTYDDMIILCYGTND